MNDHERRSVATPLVPPTPTLVSLEGLELGPYVLERPLGQGGMGSVWLARRTDGRFEGRAAVKLLNLSFLSPIGQQRFRREGTVLARLAHAGIARLLDAGVAPTGQPYLVIEHVDGEQIDTFVSTHGTSPADRIRLVLQVLDAVAHAHANLIIHRDIKPSNILVTRDGVVKLLDFGIAKLLEDGTDAPRPALTMDGQTVLTPEFAAPEQVRGEAITTATDVYSVGVLLYLLISSRHPTSDASLTPMESMRAVIERDPSRLHMGDLDSILLKALRKSPEERYQTAPAFADDLRRYLAQQPVSARPSSLAYRARKFARRNRALVTVAALGIVALMGATAFSIAQMREARTQRNVAVRAARQESALIQLQTVLAGDSRDPDGKPVSAAGRIALAEQILEKRYRAEPWLVAGVLVDLSGRFFEAGDLEAQRAMLGRARGIAAAAHLTNEVALATCTRAISFWLEDKIDSARADIREARAALGSRASGDPTTESTCLEAEGKVQQSLGRGDSGVVLLTRALAVAHDDSLDTRRLGLTNALADVLRLSGRTREAVPHFQQILDELEATGYGETEALPNVAGFLTASLLELGEFSTLDSALRVTIRHREVTAGAGRVSPTLAVLYGSAKLRLGEIDSADVWLGRAVRDSTRDGGGAIGIYLPAALTQLRLEQGRLPEASTASAQLLQRFRGQRATAAMLRAQLMRASGDPGRASAPLEHQLDVLLHDGRPSLTAFALPLVTAGEWRLAAADARGADSLARLARTAAALDSVALVRSGLAGRAELLLARALRVRGDATGAAAAARRAEVALGNGYGQEHRWTRGARALVDSLGDAAR